MMNSESVKQLKANIKWFNQFFEDLNWIHSRIWDLLPDSFFEENFDRNRLSNQTDKGNNISYTKYNAYPTIPDYLPRGLQGQNSSLQIATILNPEGMIDKYYSVEFSVFIALISATESSAWGYYETNIMRIIKNDKIEDLGRNGKVIRGNYFNQKANKKIDFSLVQVPLSKFEVGNGNLDVDEIIREEIMHHLFR